MTNILLLGVFSLTVLDVTLLALYIRERAVAAKAVALLVALAKAEVAQDRTTMNMWAELSKTLTMKAGAGADA